ncbi:MAG: hypothetical protein WCI05_16865 [Myxococcales bacterium]
MGKLDRRKSLKMIRRKGQVGKKARLARARVKPLEAVTQPATPTGAKKPIKRSSPPKAATD